MEYQLARRTAHSQSGGRGAVMMRIATITVALGLAVMIVTLAVFTGFRREIVADFRGFSSDVEIIDISGFGRSEPQPMERDEELELFVQQLPEVRSVAEYAVAGCMIKSGERVVGLQLKGIGADYPTEWWEESMVEGTLPDVKAENRTKQLLISQATARALEVAVGDKLELLYIDGGERPRRDSFRVAGIYSTGMEEMDRTIALADVRDVRRLAGWSADQIMGYDVMLHNAADADAVAERIDKRIAALSRRADDAL